MACMLRANAFLLREGQVVVEDLKLNLWSTLKTRCPNSTKARNVAFSCRRLINFKLSKVNNGIQLQVFDQFQVGDVLEAKKLNVDFSLVF